MGTPREITGLRFGRLTAVEPTDERSDRKIVWICKCECGNIIKVPTRRLISGNTKSCGCYKLDLLIYRSLKHGFRTGGCSTSTYSIWQNMKSRCRNVKHPMYKYYGGRGITYCERWETYQNFLADMGERPEGLTLHRKNNDGNYNTDNCAWVTMKEQCVNRRPKNTAIQYQMKGGEKLCG